MDTKHPSVMLVVIWAALCSVHADDAYSELLADYRSSFATEAPTHSSWTGLFTTDSSCYAIIEDPANQRGFLASCDSAIFQIDLDKTAVMVILGNETKRGFRDGIGTEVLFRKITDFTYVDSRNTIVMAERVDGCLREVSRAELNISTFAGNCANQGDRNGHRLSSLFQLPHSILYHKETELLYISLRNARNIKVISLITDLVDDFLTLNAEDRIYGFCVPFNQSEPSVVVGDLGIWRNSGAGFTNILSISSSSRHRLKRIVDINDELYILTNDEASKVVVMDSVTGNYTTLCQSNLRYSPGDVVNCSTPNSISQGILASKGSVYIPSVGEGTFSLTSIKLNCSYLGWGEWSSCNSTHDATGMQMRTKQHGCQSESRPCNKHLTDALNFRRTNNCALEFTATTKRNRLECATSCLLDKNCLGFHYTAKSLLCEITTEAANGGDECYYLVVN